MRSFFIFSFSLFLFFHGAISASVVEETCKRAGQSNPQLNYNFCIATFQADPKSKTADLRGLGIILTELLIPKANNIASQAATLSRGGNLNPFAKKCLQDCSSLYSDAISTIKGVFSDFKARDYSSANVHLSSAMDASSTCEEGFTEKKGLVSPLTKVNKDFSQMTSIALAITNMFH